MAKRFVRITLATKCRLLFGVAAIVIIGSTLIAPVLYTETLADEAVLLAGREVTRLYFHEWMRAHAERQPAERVSDLFTARVDPAPPLDAPLRRIRLHLLSDPGQLPVEARLAAKAFHRDPAQPMVQLPNFDNDSTRKVFRAIRAVDACLACHERDPQARDLTRGQLVGLIEAELPADASPRNRVIRRGVILIGGFVALLLALMTFYFVIQRLILSPVGQLKAVADRVAEGDLTTRSEVRTGDEFEQLGDSFNEMLHAVQQSQHQLRTANRALDLKLNELTESNVALFEANRLKGEFLANISHELRTPLNSIIGFAELLSESDDARIKRYGGNILTPARMLLRMINDLLDLARVEASNVKLTVTRVSPSDICETLVSLVTPQAEKKNLRLTLEVDGTPPIIRTDAGKVQQILYNLLDNAIKFTPAGGSVTVRATFDADADAIVIDVTDTGPGISEADQPHIFEKFYQADASTTRAHGGVGLGLAIARDLATILGGTLTLRSTPSEGTTFTLTLPPQIPAPEGRRAPEAAGDRLETGG
ncbi:MAG: HAMP domain-containing histidine kinase [Planctomycetes bacterium]|nr:HAMP domain-containing histidine kinase [Planctomycetota bacterium]